MTNGGGGGFTEWTTVRGAKPLFEGHSQPVSPLNDNYYDLMDKNVMRWQADLMHEYGVDGQLFYHYWFGNDKKILEKPAENLLKWKDIDMPFCFFWVNQTWARTWSTIKNAAAWTELYGLDEKNDNGILMLQTYGGSDEWKKHYRYLEKFFLDSRYIKVDNKPVLGIYEAFDIPCLGNMLDLWDRMAKKSGFNGIYLIGNDFKQSDEFVFNELLYGRTVCDFIEPNKKSPAVYNYDNVWRTILSFKVAPNTTKIAFVNYDDTPRHGREGMLFSNGSPEKFKSYLEKLLIQNSDNGCNFTIVCAWNEWGEGSYLEPDSKNGYKYLEAVQSARKALLRNEKINKTIYNEDLKKLRDFDVKLKRSDYYIGLLQKWIEIENKDHMWINKALEGYKRIIIYGYGLLGKILVQKLKSTNIKIDYIVDRKKINVNDLITKTPEEVVKDDTLMVVTPTYYYNEIFFDMKKRGIKNIVSLEYIMRRYDIDFI